MSQQPAPSRLSAREVHREQVWAALVRAVDYLLEEAEDRLLADAEQARLASDLGILATLEARTQALRELRREVTSAPPSGS